MGRACVLTPCCRFKPGELHIDPAAIFASSLLGILGVDFALQSMNAPSIQRYVRERRREKRQVRSIAIQTGRCKSQGLESATARLARPCLGRPRTRWVGDGS